MIQQGDDIINKYKTIYSGASGEIEVKKSKFIASISPANTEEEAISFIDEMEKKYYDARHNCTAYIISTSNKITRFNDDGEPSRTAGLPMLNILQGENLHNVVAVVTRYFGGTLLGTGGLIRAYSDAVKEGLKYCTIIEKQKAMKFSIEMDYTTLGKIQYLLSEEQIPILDTIYTDVVKMIYVSPVDVNNSLQEKLMEVTNGNIEIAPQNELYYSELAGKLLLFDS